MLRKRLLPPFLLTEAILYIVFLHCDLTGAAVPGTALKYAALLLCAALSYTGLPTRDGRLGAAALTLTAAADLFLLVLDRCYTAGVALFCLVQLLYALRLRAAIRPARPVWPRPALSITVIVLLFLTGAASPLTILTAVYFPQLLCNALESFYLPPSARSRIFSAGLWCFVLCDICVGLHNASAYAVALPQHVTELVQIGMWFFYLPSQVLIVLSAYRRFPE